MTPDVLMQAYVLIILVICCFGWILYLWNSNSTLRRAHVDDRVRRVSAEAALSFAANLPAHDRAEFIWQYHFGGTPAVGYPAWPQFLQARINVALDNRS
ncbi:hypothetical protein GOZ94_00640 [Agrobacterium vitis]|uniref:hypothetical protein n=1 Tax=Agrobacterium vitis TaxID=373 RepID=UPI0012E8AA51|nr:hypothetical protein [Agrobacterium vitis]MVA17452.1 hypothetical protein [Agrobacterium vitis]